MFVTNPNAAFLLHRDHRWTTLLDIFRFHVVHKAKNPGQYYASNEGNLNAKALTH